MSNIDLFGNAASTFELKAVCANCMDFDSKNNTCTIRYLIHNDKTKSPMPRKPNQKGCQVFMRK